MTETKRPEFNLHKKPPPEKLGGFSVSVTKEGSVTVKMGKYVAFEGLTRSDACDLATLLLSVGRQGLGGAIAGQLERDRAIQGFTQGFYPSNRQPCACQCGGYGLGGPPDPYRRILG